MRSLVLGIHAMGQGLQINDEWKVHVVMILKFRFYECSVLFQPIK